MKVAAVRLSENKCWNPNMKLNTADVTSVRVSKPKAGQNIRSVMISHDKSLRHDRHFSLQDSESWTLSRIQLCSESPPSVRWVIQQLRVRLEVELPGGHLALVFSSHLSSIWGHVLHLPWCRQTLASQCRMSRRALWGGDLYTAWP